MTTAIVRAGMTGRIKTVKYLVENKADTLSRYKCIRMASEHGHIEIVKYLIESNIDISSDNNYCARWASICDHLETIKFLVENKADVSVLKSEHKKIIFGLKILNFWRKYKKRRRLIRIRNMLIPIYYSPNMKGGYFARKDLEKFVDRLNTTSR